MRNTRRKRDVEKPQESMHDSITELFGILDSGAEEAEPKGLKKKGNASTKAPAKAPMASQRTTRRQAAVQKPQVKKPE